MSAEGFHGLWLSFCEEHPNYKFLLASIQSLTNCENPSSNIPLQKACSGFPIAACNSKSCSESRLWSWKLLRKAAMNEHKRKLTNEREGKLNRNLMQLSEQSLELISVLKESSRNFAIIFLCNKAKIYKTIICAKCACKESSVYWFNFIGLQQYLVTEYL